jgi:hypothetical protein
MECGLLQAIDFTRTISAQIADEIEAYAEFIEVEGDIYGMAGGLRKAASIARHYEEQRDGA